MNKLQVRACGVSFCRAPGRHAAKHRRGVLLLVVLSMLTLFMMLGVAYLLTATRAKETARAYARLTFGGDDARVPYAQLLDQVLLSVVRGPVVGKVPGSISSGTYESLLADKYGPSAAGLSGTLQGAAFVGPLMSATVSLSGSTQPTDLNGRVLTLASPGRPVTSHRIIRAQSLAAPNSNAMVPAGMNIALWLDLPVRVASLSPVSSGSLRINSREFAGTPSVSPPSNEAWDGFDDHNLFLAHVSPGTTVSSSTVSRLSYAQGLSPAALIPIYDPDVDLIIDAADNDNDGVYDGVFQDFGIPDAADASGNTVNIRASVLIVDLDGRFNVNAHDSLARLLSSGSSRWPATLPFENVPLGSGYGPAEINGASGTRRWTGNATWASGTYKAIFPGQPPGAPLISGSTFDTSENPTLFALIGGASSRMTGQRAAGVGSRFSPGPTVRLASAEGRYGELASVNWGEVVGATLSGDLTGRFPRPGISRVDDPLSQLSDRRSANDSENLGIPAVWWLDANGANTGSKFNWSNPIIVPSSIAFKSTMVTATTAVTVSAPRGIYNSPPDLHGRMKTLTLAPGGSGIIPQIAFAKPEWSGTSADSGRETTDDPYEVSVDTRTGRGGWLFDPASSGTTQGSLVDNPFTPAELEPVLRPYDIDANRLPPRLAAILGSVAEESRLKITTDSWDTTALTGGSSGSGAAARIHAWLRTTNGQLYPLAAPTEGVISGEIARGERFDLNRPLAPHGSPTASLQRQAYFKDLFTLLIALGGTAGSDAKSLAQWAANVIEFRDADSSMTRFPYDANPADGWSPTANDAVWGAERPEMLITETSAWEDDKTGELFVMLHRPWNAKAYGGVVSGTAESIAAEPVDVRLDTVPPSDTVDLGRKSGTAAFSDDATYPIWRLRIVDDANSAATVIVRFDMQAAGGNAEYAPSSNTAVTTPRLGADAWLCVMGQNSLNAAVPDGDQTVSTGTSGRVVVSGASPFRVPGQLPTTRAPDRTATVYLERLDDLSAVASTGSNASAWTTGTAALTTSPSYRIVDSAPITVVNRVKAVDDPNPPAPPGVRRRNADLAWKSQFGGLLLTPYSLQPANMQGGNGAWFPWPNRPFNSSAELILVPGRDPRDMLANYRQPSVAANDIPPSIASVLFDAVHVPTRFAGIHVTSTNAVALLSAGVFSETTPVNQLSSFREPGRVNLNTVVSDDVWNAVVAGPLPNPVKTRAAANLSSAPAQNMAALLALTSGSAGIIQRDADPTVVGWAWGRNPMHEIYTATRLANTVTPRSNVFAIWITLRESVANDPDSVRYRRAFYIVDRSIPVGFEEGKDLNVWDCVRLRRIIE